MSCIDVNVKVEIKDLDKLIDTIGKLFNGVADIGAAIQNEPVVEQEPIVETVVEKPKKVVKKTVAKDVTEISDADTVKPVEDAKSETPLKREPISLEELRHYASELGRTGQGAKARAWLDKYGYANITALINADDTAKAEFIVFAKAQGVA